MADSSIAIQYLLKQEDSTLSGKVTTDAGGRTRFGVAEKFHPSLTNTGFYDTMETANALNTAIGIFNQEYAIPLQLTNILDQDTANAILSFAANIGLETEVKLLQQAINVPIDGKIGPVTLGRLNSSLKAALLRLMYNFHIYYYTKVVQDNPVEEVNLTGWTNRTNQNCLMQYT